MKLRFNPLMGALLAAGVLLAAPLAQAKELKSIGVTVGDLANPFFVQITKGVEKKARELAGDNVNVTLVSSGYDLGQQVGQIDNFIAAKVDMIVLNAADSKGIGPAVKRAKEAGIVVVAVDVAAVGADATITSDNTQAGQIACKYIADRLKAKGNVVIINGPPVSAVQNRVEGCMTELKQHPEIKLLSYNQNAKGSREGGLEVMTSLLSANPHIDGVFAINDPTAIGADLAAKQAQRSEFFIVGVDGSPDGEEALKRKNSLFVATPAQDPQVMAARAVEIGYDLLQGKPAPDAPVLIPVTMIDRDNIGSYKGWTVK
ncbi:ABC transporter substrate-binding protein [Nissabacter sp. SGAir0207]|uniref:ABC transporter substrate-binding protein n=1 Tax=Nissabacter sp. SGAir0207 TaxID=2126321 RepID=UPI0010CD1CBF|nr:ABC transporter substrate-binding protein [Nissabacter sp. SGAir0207]QCR36944.1 transcriptional regulator [Nissabacter sp. SGAir0207]